MDIVAQTFELNYIWLPGLPYIVGVLCLGSFCDRNSTGWTFLPIARYEQTEGEGKREYHVGTGSFFPKKFEER